MHIPQQVTQPINSPNACSICHQIKPDELNHCSDCGDAICGTCPAFSCSCVSPGLIGQLCRELRTAATELAELQAVASLMGADYLSTLERARLLLLTDVVASLSEEINGLDEDEHGEGYSA